MRKLVLDGRTIYVQIVETMAAISLQSERLGYEAVIWMDPVSLGKFWQLIGDELKDYRRRTKDASETP